jgi:cadmium resistance protein CadD (predicted permease)
LFFGGGKYKSSAIIAGQYLGIATLVLIAVAGSFIGSFIDQRHIGFLGLFPIYLAVRQVIELLKGEDNAEDKADIPLKSAGMLAIAGVTIANGGDNIGIYIPLLTTLDTWAKIQLVIIFALMTYLWCIFAKYLSHHPLLAKSLNKYGHIIMPVVLFLLGVFIIYESESVLLF